MHKKAPLAANNPLARRYDAKAVTSAGFALVIGILLLTIVGGHLTGSRHNQLLSQLVERSGSKSAQAQAMREAARERINRLRAMAIQADPFRRDEERMHLLEHAARYTSARDSLAGQLDSVGERRIFGQLEARAERLERAETRALEVLFDDATPRSGIEFAVQGAIEEHLAALRILDQMLPIIHQTTQHSIQQASIQFHEGLLKKTLAAMAAFAVTLIIAAVVVTNAGTRHRQLSHHAAHDLLTGLLNRQAFEAALRLTLEQNRYVSERHALLFLDLDRFKVVNDSCGHAAGDALLRALSARLVETLRNSDVLARLGGDEFGVLLRFTEAEDAEAVAEKIRRTIGEFSFFWAGQTFTVGASIGMVPFGDESTGVEDLLSAADACCNSAKEEGRNRVHQADDQAEMVRRRSGEMRWVARITEAMRDDRFELYGQMIKPVDPGLDEGRLRLEVLLRMQDDSGLGVITPGQFLPAAERYGIVPDIDRWVVRESLRWLAGMGTTAENMRININICGPAASDPHFHRYVRSQIAETGVPPDSLCFEITESTAIRSLANAAALVDALSDLGCQFALDDFGAGLSSFNQLRYLNVGYLKIDGSFIQNIDRDPINRAMVESINTIGKKLGKRTVAEFVENERINKILQEIGVDYVQGFGLHRPEPLSDIRAQILRARETQARPRLIVA